MTDSPNKAQDAVKIAAELPPGAVGMVDVRH
jgi:hypothetical protein